MRTFQNPNHVARWQISLILVCQLVLSKKANAKVVIKYTNTIYVSDVIRVIEEAVSAKYESVCMTTMIRYLCTSLPT